MNHKLVIEEIVNRSYCAKRELKDIVIHELRHMGMDTVDYNKCIKELENICNES